MTLFEEVYAAMQEQLVPFYRFEGFGSFSYFDTQNSEHFGSAEGYVYFSGSKDHHCYYADKRLRQAITDRALLGTGLDLSRKTLSDDGSFGEIISLVENYSFPEDVLSIECCTLPVMKTLLKNNTILNSIKARGDRRVERVDIKTEFGGYGFTGDWMRVLELLTVFYSYRRITAENMVEFLQLYRHNVVGDGESADTTPFLKTPNNSTIEINPVFCDSSSRYRLMNSLEGIVRDGLYCPNSIFSENSAEQISRIVHGYNAACEELLKKSETGYQKRMRGPYIGG